MKTAVKKRTKKLKSLKHITKLSQLLALGLRDLAKQERGKNCRVDMGEWLVMNGECIACLAGSVMRHSMVLPEAPEFIDLGRKYYEITQYDNCTHNRLRALNHIRSGSVADAAWRIGLKTKLASFRQVANYDKCPSHWWADMRKLLADLRKAGE
jgi:hypothetical protein